MSNVLCANQPNCKMYIVSKPFTLCACLWLQIYIRISDVNKILKFSYLNWSIAWTCRNARADTTRYVHWSRIVGWTWCGTETDSVPQDAAGKFCILIVLMECLVVVFFSLLYRVPKGWKQELITQVRNGWRSSSRSEAAKDDMWAHSCNIGRWWTIAVTGIPPKTAFVWKLSPHNSLELVYRKTELISDIF